MPSNTVDASTAPITYLLRICLTMLAAYQNKGKISPEVRGKLPAWLAGAATFCQNHKITPTHIGKLVNGTIAGKFGVDAKLDEAAVAFGDQLKSRLSSIALDRSLSTEQVAALRNFSLWLRTDSENAIKQLTTKAVPLAEDGSVSQLFVPSVPEGKTVVGSQQKALAQKLKNAVKGLIGKEKYSLTREEAEKAKAAKPTLYAEFLALNSQCRDIFRQELRNVLRSSGQALMDIGILQNALTKRGIVVQYFLDNFKGQVDEKGDLYTSNGIKIHGKPGGGFGTLSMNPAWNPKTDDQYVFKVETVSETGVITTNRFYTVDYKKVKNVEKDEKIDDLTQSIDKVRKKWLTDMVGRDKEKASLALILEIAYSTQARIGSNKSSGTEARGVTTWLNSNLNLSQTQAVFKYVGKSGVNQEHVLKAGQDPMMRRVLEQLRVRWQPSQPKNYLFRRNSGNTPFASQQVNLYLRSLGTKASVHKLRHVKGTKLAAELMEKCPLKPGKVTEKQANDWLKSLYEQVGILLGHKKATGEAMWTTSRQSYVAPSIANDFYDKFGFKHPDWLQKLNKLRNND